MTPQPLPARHHVAHSVIGRIAISGAVALFATVAFAPTAFATTVHAAGAVEVPVAETRMSSMGAVAVRDVALRITDARRHLKLVKSSPAADTVMATAPTAIRLWLSEPAEVPATKIAITTAAGVAVKTSAVTRAATKDAPLEAKIPTPLANGAYTVTWKAMSKDGHVVNGTFAFTVGAK